MLKPFLALRQMGNSHQVGTAVAAFVTDVKRAGGLYRDSYKILEDWIVHWVYYAQQSSDAYGDRMNTILLSILFLWFIQYSYVFSRLGQDLIEYCKPNPTLCAGFKGIDLSYWCRQPDTDRDAHVVLHRRLFSRYSFKSVLNWLSVRHCNVCGLMVNLIVDIENFSAGHGSYCIMEETVGRYRTVC
jgi:hypothetical protein